MKQFDKNAEAYQRIRGKISYPESLYEALEKMSLNHRYALDIGCGNGVSTGRLTGRYQNIEGVDLGENLIVQARDNFPEIAFSVGKAEEFTADKQYDLITSATSFYWMDREKVAAKLPTLLAEGGVFCAYKYDWPVVYGSLRDFIESELSQHWCHHRDRRIVDYDNSAEILTNAGGFADTSRRVFPNIVSLTPEEVALFFLSTSYVTRYIEQSGHADYPEQFLNKVLEIATESSVNVNFDIHAYVARN